MGSGSLLRTVGTWEKKTGVTIRLFIQLERASTLDKFSHTDLVGRPQQKKKKDGRQCASFFFHLAVAQSSSRKYRDIQQIDRTELSDCLDWTLNSTPGGCGLVDGLIHSMELINPFVMAWRLV